MGRALGGVLKTVAKKALPVVGGALGSMVAPGIGTAIGSKLGSMAGGLFEVELEGLPQEQAEMEVARRYVNLAAASARNAALARPRPSVNPRTVARAAVARAARAYAPGVYRTLAPSLKAAASAARRGMATARRRPTGFRRPGIPGIPGIPIRPTPQRPYGGGGVYSGPGSSGPGSYAAPDPWGEPAFGQPASAGFGYGLGDGDGVPLTGRWVRRGRKLIVLGA